MLSLWSILRESKNFTSSHAISTAPPTPTDHCRVPGARESTSPWSKPTERGRDLVPLSHAEVFTTDELTNACLEHPIFLKVTDPVPLGPARSRAGSNSWKTRGCEVGAHPVRGGPEPRRPRGQTTNVLTAANLVYAIRAGITAAAGTRLAL